MPSYDFICIDNNGRYFRGELTASDTKDLARRLVARGQFLTWNRALDLNVSFTVDTHASFSDLIPLSEAEAVRLMANQGKRPEERLPRRTNTHGHKRSRGLFQFLLRLRSSLKIERTVGAVIGVLLGIYAGNMWIHRLPPIPPEMAHVYPKMKALRQNMTRGELETIFTTRARGVQVSTTTRYSEGAWILEVYYGKQGGPGNDRNQVQNWMLTRKPPVGPSGRPHSRETKP